MADMAVPRRPRLLLLTGFLALMAAASTSEGAIPRATLKQIRRINRAGRRLGLVVPNAFEMNPLLQSPSFVQDEGFPFLDFAGKTRTTCWVTSASFLQGLFVKSFILYVYLL